MPFDTSRWNMSARQGDVAGIALYAATGLLAMRNALNSIRNGDDPDLHLKRLDEAYDALNKAFEDMSGYQPSGASKNAE